MKLSIGPFFLFYLFFFLMLYFVLFLPGFATSVTEAFYNHIRSQMPSLGHALVNVLPCPCANPVEQRDELKDQVQVHHWRNGVVHLVNAHHTPYLGAHEQWRESE